MRKIKAETVFCACGCGQTRLNRTKSIGRYLKYIRGHNKHAHTFVRGEKHPDWKGGRQVTNRGYVLIKCYNHPRATPENQYRLLEHHVIMEQALGRTLLPNEVVHHINGIKTDNRLENLQLMTKTEHDAHHWHLRKSGGELISES